MLAKLTIQFFRKIEVKTLKPKKKERKKSRPSYFEQLPVAKEQKIKSQSVLINLSKTRSS